MRTAYAPAGVAMPSLSATSSVRTPMTLRVAPSLATKRSRSATLSGKVVTGVDANCSCSRSPSRSTRAISIPDASRNTASVPSIAPRTARVLPSVSPLRSVSSQRPANRSSRSGHAYSARSTGMLVPPQRSTPLTAESNSSVKLPASCTLTLGARYAQPRHWPSRARYSVPCRRPMRSARSGIASHVATEVSHSCEPSGSYR